MCRIYASRLRGKLYRQYASKFLPDLLRLGKDSLPFCVGSLEDQEQGGLKQVNNSLSMIYSEVSQEGSNFRRWRGDRCIGGPVGVGLDVARYALSRCR